VIPGISDVQRLPRLGKIRLGEKRQSKSGKEYPAALDHFNFKDAPEVEKVYGKNCRELEIMFPVDDPGIFFPQELKAYRTSGLFCRSNDGQTATRVRVGLSDGKGRIPKGRELDPDGEAYLKRTGEAVDVGSMFDLPCPYHECSFFQNKFCKGVGRLLFMLPKVPRFGCYEITTSSWNSMVSVNNYVKAIQGAAGRVSLIPLKLKLVPQKASVDGKAKTIHVLEIVYEGATQTLLAMAKHRPTRALAVDREDPKEVPDDLVPHGGAALDEKLGGNGDKGTDRPAMSVEDVRSRFSTTPEEEASADEIEGSGVGFGGSEPAEEEAPAGPARSGRPW